MPTILRHGNYRVVIYPNDHRPSHVHVIGPDWEAVFNLNCPEGPVELREAYELGRKAINQIEREIEAARAVLCVAWGGINHGN